MGFFVTLEGIEGCGKSTQAKRLEAALRARGLGVVLTREPGGTEVTKEIRRLLADPDSRLDPMAELLLFLADRAQHVATVILPALAAGKVVVCDRYSDSTMAYQGYGRGHDLEWLEGLNRRASGGLVPDLTLWIDCAVEVGLGRAKKRAGGPGDRFEIEPIEFHSVIRGGFAEIAARSSERVVRIDGDRGEDEIAADCLAAVDARLSKAVPGTDSSKTVPGTDSPAGPVVKR